MAKSKSKSSQGKKKKKLHPLLVTLAGFFSVMLLAVAFTAHMYKDVSPLQEVAGAEATASAHKTQTSTPTPKTCTLIKSIVGTGSCPNNTYSTVTVTCGDGTTPTISFGKSTTAKPTTTACHNITDWMVQVAKACNYHSSCPIPTTLRTTTGDNGRQPQFVHLPPVTHPTTASNATRK